MSVSRETARPASDARREQVELLRTEADLADEDEITPGADVHDQLPAGEGVRPELAAGASQVRPHARQQLFASVLIRAGLSIKEIQRLLGHKAAVKALDTCGHLMGDEDDRSLAAIRQELGEVADYLRIGEGS